jgi:hypothetical protein
MPQRKASNRARDIHGGLYCAEEMAVGSWILTQRRKDAKEH